MLFLLDMNHLCHMMFHAGRNKRRAELGDAEADADLADVLDWVLIRLDNLKWYVQQMHGRWGADDFRLIACFDGGGGNFRKDIVPSYKEGRERSEQVYELIDDVTTAVKSSDEWLAMIAPPRFEADDLMASIAKQHNGQVMIHSIDKDMHQCLVPSRVGIIKRSGMEDLDVQDRGMIVGSQLVAQHYRAVDMEMEFGFKVSRWVDYQCLVGDKADNINGAKGYGHVTAKRILAAFPGDPIDTLTPEVMMSEGVRLNVRHRENWQPFLERLPVLREVFTLRTDIEYSLGEPA